MAKKKLVWDLDTRFKVYGIYAPIRLYRLAWLLNDNLNINFCRVEDLKINLHKNQDYSHHHLFSFGNEEQDWELKLVQNKGSKGALIKHNPLPLAILKLNGEWGMEYLESIVDFCNNEKEIIACKEYNLEEINNKDIITFDV